MRSVKFIPFLLLVVFTSCHHQMQEISHKSLQYHGDIESTKRHLKESIGHLGMLSFLQEQGNDLKIHKEGSLFERETEVNFHFIDDKKEIQISQTFKGGSLDFSSPNDLVNKISFDYYQN